MFFSENGNRWQKGETTLVYDGMGNLLLTYNIRGFFTKKKTVEFFVSDLVEDGFELISDKKCRCADGNEFTIKKTWIPVINPYIDIYLNEEKVGEVRRKFSMVPKLDIRLKPLSESLERNLLLFFICFQTEEHRGGADMGGD